MIKKILWVASTLNIIASVVFLTLIPEQKIAVHFGVDGTPNRWGSKWEMLIICWIPLALNIFFVIYQNVTKNNSKYNKNRKIENIVIPAIILFFVCLNWLMLTSVFDRTNTENSPLPRWFFAILMVSFGILFIIMGNFMGKIQQNRSLGMRIYWTLHNKIVWKKAHRLYGLLCVVCGFLILIFGGLSVVFKFNFLSMFIVFFVLVIISFIVPSVYSYWLYHKLEKK
ncbi:hypothetical protein AGMMS50284_1330 [Clostridia bacterium]|nr:hypothetical protein AGMMS50284_1330 [Clostridia bacterium]